MSQDSNQWWRLLLLALTSFSVPILMTSFSSFYSIENRMPSSCVEEVKKQEESKKKTSSHSSAHSCPSSKLKIKTQSTPSSPSSFPDENPSHIRQFRGSLRRSYSIEESSCENGTVYLPENVELGSLTTLGLQQPFVIAMVGLPARGKSHIVKMMIRYLRWTGFEAQVFNVGSYRRDVGGLSGINSDFFSHDNTDAKHKREEMAREVQNIMYRWLHIVEASKKGRVAIFDATNTTVDRRQELCNRARKEQVGLLFVESICDDVAILEENYLSKLNNDDYREMDQVAAKEDFVKRVAAYEAVSRRI
jgi:hypothetical protein